MAKVFTNETNLHNIGDAIREKNESETTYKPSEMAAAILALPTYPEPTGTKAINTNGTHDVKDYASANVNVPNSYAAGDEGKVVSNGALVSQGSQTITQNGTYDTTLISELIANISGGGGGGSTNILSGTDAPTSAQGSDGSIYLQYARYEGNLPSGYTPLSFVEFTGAQSFDVDISVNTSDLKVVSNIIITEVGIEDIWGGSWAINGFFFMVYQEKFRWHSGGKSVDTGSIVKDKMYSIETNKSKLIVDGTEYVLSSPSGTDASVDLCFGNVYNSSGTAGKMKLFRTKVYSGTTLIADFIPCKDDNNVVCLYDAIRENTYYSQTSTQLVAGDSEGVILRDYLKVSGAWQSLIGSDIDDVNTGGGSTDDWTGLTDYIESSGTQYIDTGYNVKANSAFEIIANASTSNSQYPTLFGVRRSNMTGSMAMFAKYNNDTRAYYNWGGSNTADAVLYSHFNFNGNKTKYQISKNQVIAQADNGKIASIPVTGTDAVNDLSVYVFSLNEGGSDMGSICHCTGKLYRFRIYEDDALVHEFIPWTDANDVVCLKDTVTGDFKYNAGTGVFTRGTDA